MLRVEGEFSKKNNSELIPTGFDFAQGSHQVISEIFATY